MQYHQNVKADGRISSINGTSKLPYLDMSKRENSGGQRRTTRGKQGRVSLTQADKNVVRQMISSKVVDVKEKKFYGYELSTQAVLADSFGPTIVSSIPQGTTDSSRVGDSVRLDRMRLAYNFIAGDNANVVRIIFFQWRLQSTPLLNTILRYGSGANAHLADYNVDLEPDYKVLFDRTHYLSLNGNSCEGDVLEIKLDGEIQFTGGSTTGINHIYGVCLSDSTAAPNPSVNWITTVYYYDD